MHIKLYLCRFLGKQYSDEHLGLNYLKTNCNANIEIVYDRKELKDCDMIGISGSMMGFKEAISILESTDIPVVIGGSITQWEGLEEYDFTHIVKGEGELAFQSIIDGKETEKVVSGFLIEDLDTLKYPYRHYRREYSPIMSSRGCFYNCYFCGVRDTWKKIRYHSIDYCMDEIEYISKHITNTKILRYSDDLFLSTEKRFFEFYEAYMKKGFHKIFELSACIRSDIVNEKTINCMKKMKLTNPFLGLESGCNKTLKLMNKRTTVEIHQRAIDLFNSIGVAPLGIIIFGFPGQTLCHVQKSIKFARKNKDKARIAGQQYIPIPGSKWYNGEGVKEMSVKKKVINMHKEIK
jgi:radical SAM superfamily enzyme YgiQ (UPF0313 family)